VDDSTVGAIGSQAVPVTGIDVGDRVVIAHTSADVPSSSSTTTAAIQRRFAAGGGSALTGGTGTGGRPGGAGGGSPRRLTPTRTGPDGATIADVTATATARRTSSHPLGGSGRVVVRAVGVAR